MMVYLKKLHRIKNVIIGEIIDHQKIFCSISISVDYNITRKYRQGLTKALF